MAGRPTLLTDPLAEQLAELLASGLSQAAAARAVGVSERSLTNWMPTRLRPLVEEARAAGPARDGAVDEARLSLTILRSGDWRASAWFLETRWPERYGLTEERDPVRWAGEDDEEWP